MTIQLNGKTPTKITMRKPGNNFATQGPCPTGFHVPTKDENIALVDTMTALGIDTSKGVCMKTYLKMPFAGQRYNSSSNVGFQGSFANYWSSTAYDYGVESAYYLYFYSSKLRTQNGNYRSLGFSIRAFKNIPVTPNSNWTTLFDGSSIATGAGIFHNTTDGLISISSDGTTWITIQDKNLGATTVYNDGDTLAESNCGYYYQRGNNNGFAWTGSVTTSSTKVDASTYGPGNYYSSSTFITVSASPYDWSSVQNDNLWGGEDGNVHMLEEKEIKKIVIFPDGVTEKQIRPVGWTPLNPMCWYKFDGDYTDATGSFGNASGTSTFQTLSSSVKVLQTDGTNMVSLPSGITANSISTYTIIFWMKPITTSPNYGYYAGCGEVDNPHISFYENTSGRDYVEWTNGSRDLTTSGVGAGWRLVCFRSNGSTCDLIVNGSNKTATTTAATIFGYSTDNIFVLGARTPGAPNVTGQRTSVQISNFVISNTYWDDTECLKMFTETKGNYGL